MESIHKIVARFYSADSSIFIFISISTLVIGCLVYKYIFRRKNKKTEEMDIVLKAKVWARSADGIAFISAAVIGFMVHMYVYTNLYLGHDATGIHSHWLYSWNVQLGRHFAPFILGLHDTLQVPLLIGFISSGFLGLSSILICRILRIKNTVYLIIISAFIVTWPIITAMNCFIFMASQFSFAIFVACLAAYVTDQYKFGFIAGIPLVAISMACYQAYWGTSAALMLFCIIRDIIINKSTTKEIIIKGLKYLTALMVGFLFYYYSWSLAVMITGWGKADHLGINNSMYESASELIINLIRTYRSVITFFLSPNARSYYPFYVMIAGWISVLIALYIIISIILKEKIYRQPPKIILLVASFGLLPFALNVSAIFSKGVVNNNALSIFAYMFPFLLLPMLLSQFDKSIIKNHLIFTRISIIVLMLSCFNGIYGANATYLKLEMNYHIAISQVTQYMSRITTESGYESDTPIAIIGQPLQPDKAGFKWCDDIPGAHNTALTYDGPIFGIFTRLNPDVNLVWDVSPYKNLEVVQNLNSFPSNDCVVWVDGVLVFKLPWLPWLD